jgi:CheY-like chemotaxis protein
VKRKFIALVADDDANDLQLLRKAISETALEMELQEVRDGEELVQYLKGEAGFGDRKRYPIPDLILIDLKMPRMDGLQVLDWLREHPEHGRLAKVMLSGSGLDEDVQEAYRRGANTYFTKPTDFEQFQKLIRVMVDYWKMSERPRGPIGW